MAKHEAQDEGREFDFTAQDFARVRKLIYQHAGISLSEAKTDMVYSRVGRRLRIMGFTTFKDYLDNLENENARRYPTQTAIIFKSRTYYSDKNVYNFGVSDQQIQNMQ